MDIGATVSRAINITFKHRVLWVLGFLAALAGGSGSGINFRLPSGNLGGNLGTTSGSVSPEMQRFLDMLQQNSGLIFAGIAGLACVILLISVVLWVISIIARGGLIGAVDQIEREGNVTFGQAWRMGAAKFWRLLGINILLYLPIAIVGIIVAVLIGGSIVAIVAAATGADGQLSDQQATGMGGGVLAVVCIGGAFACVAMIYGLIASALSTFGERAIVLDNTGVMDGIRKGWQVFRDNLGNIILLAILMFIIALVIGFVVGIIAFALFTSVIFTTIVSLNNNGTIGAGTFILGVAAFIAAVIISAVISALFVAFNSSAWTLAYRQFTGRGLVTTGAPPAAPLPTA